ncbi:DNA-binding protein [Streptomyces sp. AK08-02]|uniref:DNA-binding protein n=1 Tax=Streptomyces sp. AK08-02 TaxID=3028654 RepID=UPI0029B25737|nr:DNA-binding protein [Streptomyces sp. AK08-02]MDX3751018.1 DNA-binding protein [Streptomyces sp. AK08-02]
MNAVTTQESYEDLLKAGAVLPPDTEGAGERAVPLTARTYRHPGLDGRVVVRLVAGELGAAEDLAAGFLGLETDAEPVEVGLGLRQSLGFPEWVLVHHPEDGHHALGVVPDLERAGRQVKSKPKAALDAHLELAGQLAAAVPHFLPTFYEQAGRVFLGVENATYAAQMFTRARKAEAEHGLPVDEDRLDAVFLEFALAGALPVKVLTGYAKELAARVPADEALRRFRRLCVRRTAGGLPPSAQTAVELRRLARAAGADADAEERSYLAELLTLPATLRAALGWWKAHRTALVALARDEPEVRRTLLDVMPVGGDNELPALWLEVLEESGATAGLCSAEASERPEGGAADWLRRFLDFRGHGWRQPRLPALYPLVERMVDGLRAELAGPGTAVQVEYDVDLLDLLLAARVPVADPPENHQLRLEQWAEGEGQRDLVALEADARFRAAFRQGADRFGDDQDGRRAVRLLAASPGGRPMLAEWMREVARSFAATGLPGLPDAMHRLARIPGEALALAEDEVRAAAATDLAPVLARTLRAGLFDELHWPAWEEAAAALVPAKDVDDLVIADAWPHLIVAGPAQARVIGAEGTVLTHDLRIPARDNYGDPGYHYVDGELLVYWNSRATDQRLRGYWHTAADRPQPMADGENRTRGQRMNWYSGGGNSTLPLPGGGRTTGAGVLHRGDTAVPDERPVISDGTSYWVWVRDTDDDRASGWHEHDPATGEVGRRSLPGFFADAGGTFRAGWLLPAPDGRLLGWRSLELPDGSLRVEDPAGTGVTVAAGGERPTHAVLFPGDDVPRAVDRRGFYSVNLVDADGVVTSTARTDQAPGTFAEGTVILPPQRYWHLLQPRDPRGSAALRRIDRDTAAALLKAATADQDKHKGNEKKAELAALVRTLLPEVGHEALAAGIAGVARFAAQQQAVLDRVAAKLAETLSGGRSQDAPAGPVDRLLSAALNGFSSIHSWYGSDENHYVMSQVRFIGAALRNPAAPAAPKGSLHHDGPALPGWALMWRALPDLATTAAFRAASATTGEEHRDALGELLRELDTPGLSVMAPTDWRLCQLHLDRGLLTQADGTEREGADGQGLLRLDDGAFLLFVEGDEDSAGWEFTALFHDPAGRFEVPAPYTVRSSSPVGAARDAGWLAAFRTELAGRGPAPWFPEAAEEFAALTGVTSTTARLVVAGLPQIDVYERNFLSAEVRTLLGVKAADAALAKDELRGMEAATRQAVVAALMPADPARLWTDGPDVAAAAEVWNRLVGRRVAVPEALLADAVRAVKTYWEPSRSLPALLDPAAEPQLSQDLAWTVRGDRAAPVDEKATGFTTRTLTGAVAMAAWLAHRLPAGDPLRAALPGALTAVRDRLANPELLLDLGHYVSLPDFRKVAGAPTETGEGFERYGAVLMATADDQPSPAVRTALLDADGGDPYLAVLRADSPEVSVAEGALRTARDPRFVALLADPGDPVAGERDEDGTWWPQDASRSVPELVTEAAKEYGVSEDAAVLYLALLAMPDPTDRNTARWTGWQRRRGGAARLKAARAELAATDLVVEASRTRAGRSLFLPGGWVALGSPHVPLEQWKLPLLDLAVGQSAPLGVLVPTEPAAELYRRAWQRVRDGDGPRFEQLKVRRARRR